MVDEAVVVVIVVVAAAVYFVSKASSGCEVRVRDDELSLSHGSFGVDLTLLLVARQFMAITLTR